MNKIKTFFEKHKKSTAIVLAVLMLFFLMTSVTRRAEEEATEVSSLTEAHILSAHLVGYKTELLQDGRTLFTPIAPDPQIYLPLPSPDFNKITLNFGDFEYSGLVQVYYSEDGNLSEPNSRLVTAEGDGELVFYLPFEKNTVVRLDIDAPFMLEGIRLDSSEIYGVTRLNIAPLIILLVLVAVTALCERYIGFYKTVRECFVGLYKSLKELYQGRKYLEFALLAAWLSLAVIFGISAAVCTVFGVFGAGAKIYLFVMAALALTAFFAYSLKSGKTGAARMTFASVLIISLTFALVLPVTTYTSWDDEYHYKSTATWANMLFGMDYSLFDYNQFKMLYGTAPDYEEGSILKDGDELPPPTDKDIDLSERISASPMKFISNLPGGIVMAFTRALGVSDYSSCLYVKLADIFIYVSLVYFGIKKLKGGALIFASVAMLPSALFLSASYSCDWWINAFAIYAFSVFISELQSPERKLSLAASVKMLAAMYLSAAPKEIYVFLVAAMLFMYKDKFVSRKASHAYRAACVGTVLLALLPTMISFFVNPGSMTDDRGGEGIDSGAQLDFILSRPFAYLGILFKFLFSYISPSMANTYTVSFAYIGFGSVAFGSIAVTIMIFAAFTDKHDSDLFTKSPWFKTWGWLVFVGMTALIATALYISFTPVMHPTVNGCQYRYIFPLLPIALYMLSPAKIRHNMRGECVNTFVISALSLNALVSLFVTYLPIFI